MKQVAAILLCWSVLTTNVWAAEHATNAQEAFDAGNVAYQQQEYQKAIYAFQHATQYDPEYYEAYCLLGLMYLLNDEVSRGLNMLTYATQTFPKQGYAFGLLGDYYQTQKNTEKALEFYQKAVDLKLPRAEKKTYTERLKNLQSAKEEALNLKTAAASDIISTVQLDDTDDWSVAYATNEPDYWEITYQYKDEDILKDDWTQKTTLKCIRNKIGTKPFKVLFSDITDEFIARGIALANAESSFRSGSFTTSQGDNRSIVYAFVNGRNLCLAERTKNSRWLQQEPTIWLNQLRQIKIIGDR